MRYSRGESYNISARALQVEVFRGENLIAFISDFPGDADPVSIDKIETAQVELDLNSEPYRLSEHNCYSVSLSVIPGTLEDTDLSEHCLSERDPVVNTGMISEQKEESQQIKLKAVYKSPNKINVFSKGYFTGMTPGLSATSEGKFETHKYMFKFAKLVRS